MDVLLVGADNPLGAALRGVLAQWGRHRAAGLTVAGSRWRSERQAKKAVRKGRPDAVVDCRLAWQIAAGDVPTPADIERGHWLAKACERSGMRYILLSCDRVFAGLTGRRLRESDPADASAAPGVQMLELESRVAQAAPSALVLRTGPLFASVGRNLLTQTLERMDLAATRPPEPAPSLSRAQSRGAVAGRSRGAQSPDPVAGASGRAARLNSPKTDGLSPPKTEPGRAAEFDNRDVFCPVCSGDAARVIAAILDQLSVGARARGIYHYGSCDRATAYDFAEAALVAARPWLNSPQAELAEVSPQAETRVLDCSRLRNTFAIKQVSWRHFVNAAVQQYYRAAQSSMNSAAGRLG